MTSNQTITLTFGDAGENHVGMQIIGQRAERGFSIELLNSIATVFAAGGFQVEHIDLTSQLPIELRAGNSASILIIRRYVQGTGSEQFMEGLSRELFSMNYDTKALMKGKVVNKHARHNLMVSETAQEPDYATGRGRILAYNSCPFVNEVRKSFTSLIGTMPLICELNYYFDTTQCGIGFHGDTERNVVMGVRVGQSMPLVYQWFHRNKVVGPLIRLTLNNGDLYFMSEKAVGNDWKSSSLVTLRHAAGAEKYLQYKPNWV